MEIGFSVREAVNQRYSVRTFDERIVDTKTKEKILSYAATLNNPLGPRPNYKFIEKSTAPNGEKLGTYGVIKGAFADAMEIKEHELFPIISPVGYPAAQKRVTEKLFRQTLKADKRMPWEKLFFMNDFNTPLPKAEAGKYQFPLEMLRLAPSAVNKQPWRVLFSDNVFHFFEKHSLTNTESDSVGMHRIDVGIAICHFHLAAIEQNLSGKFEKRVSADLVLPPDTTYITSYVVDSI